MIREIITPESNTYVLTLPDEMVGKIIEVVAFELEEMPEINGKKTIDQLNQELSGLTVNINDFKFNRDEANNYD